jgi:gliding motility-associated-like protein
MRIVISLFALLVPVLLAAQPTAGLIAYYDFDNDNGSAVDQTGNISNNGITGIEAYDCGVEELSIQFDGIDDMVTIEGSEVINIFDTRDITISFYFKSLNTQMVQTQTLMSKRENCSNNNAFAIRYTPSSGFINVIFTENAGISSSISATLSPDHCWHHIVLVRESNELRLIADGFEVGEAFAPERVDLTNDAIPFSLGASSCDVTDGLFEGFMDEVRLYDRALSELEIESLYFRPDQIANGFINVNIPKDTTIYLGNTVQAQITGTCNDQVLWFPDEGVNNTLIPEPVLEPSETTTYFFETTDQFGCMSLDSFRINVIDPSTLECTAFLPNAFTPNDDGLNDLFGVDNPFALTDFIGLEIQDRWGNRVFFTSDPFIRWDGFYRSTPVNPGVYIYRVRYRCSGEEKAQVGTFKIIR